MDRWETPGLYGNSSLRSGGLPPAPPLRTTTVAMSGGGGAGGLGPPLRETERAGQRPSLKCDLACERCRAALGSRPMQVPAPSQLSRLRRRMAAALGRHRGLGLMGSAPGRAQPSCSTAAGQCQKRPVEAVCHRIWRGEAKEGPASAHHAPSQRPDCCSWPRGVIGDLSGEARLQTIQLPALTPPPRPHRAV